jgi:hypothetical protein
MQWFFIFGNAVVEKRSNLPIDPVVKLQDMTFRDFFVNCEHTEGIYPLHAWRSVLARGSSGVFRAGFGHFSPNTTGFHATWRRCSSSLEDDFRCVRALHWTAALGPGGDHVLWILSSFSTRNRTRVFRRRQLYLTFSEQPRSPSSSVRAASPATVDSCRPATSPAPVASHR